MLRTYRTSRRSSQTVLALALLFPPLAGSAQAQDPPDNLPSPFALASSLDLECRPAQGLPPAPGLIVRQLNPVLQPQIPPQQAQLGPLNEVCVPVAKNGQIPPPSALAINRWVDLACYDAAADSIGIEVKVSHLNPQLAGLPDETVKIVKLEQVCLPVMKNNVEPPPAIKAMVRHFDFGCYALEEPTIDPDQTLVLSHLNPVIQQMNLPNRTVEMKRAHQLCVPISKNNQPVPPAVRQFVEWIDFLKYRVVPELPPAVLPLWLSHLNPLYADQEAFFTALTPDRVRLMVPIAKDGHLPPGAPAPR